MKFFLWCPYSRQDVDSEMLLNQRDSDERIVDAPRVRKATHRYGMKTGSERYGQFRLGLQRGHQAGAVILPRRD